MRRGGVLGAAGLLIASGLLLAALLWTSPGGLLPLAETLPEGFTVVETVAGGEAAVLVDRLHGRGVAPRENIIERLAAPGGAITVYRSLYTTGAEADAAAGRMRERIRKGGFGFSYFAEVREAAVPVARCAGQGRIHFFFAASHQLYWVEAEPAALPAAWTFVAHTVRTKR